MYRFGLGIAQLGSGKGTSKGILERKTTEFGINEFGNAQAEGNHNEHNVLYIYFCPTRCHHSIRVNTS
jgi:hypothetical protein